MAVDGKPLHVPGPGIPKRTPQLLRDLKPERRGVPETIEQVPLRLAIPLLVGKAHSELHEVTEDPGSAEEYGDVLDVLRALAAACGHSPEVIEAVAAQSHVSDVAVAACEDLSAHTVFMLAAGRLHSALEAVARDLGNMEGHADAMLRLRSLARLADVEWDAVLSASAEKSARLGGFTGHKLWSAHP